MRERDLRRALALVGFLRDPALPGLVLMAVLVLVGFGAIVFAYDGAARTIYVPLQFPEVVSGGIGGLALIGLGSALFNIQVDRRDAAHEQQITDDMLGEVAELMALAPKIRAVALRRRSGNRPPSGPSRDHSV